MNIAMISYHTCPLATLGGKDTGGMNVYVDQLTRHLGQKGIHVDVFTRSQDEHVPYILHDLGYGNRVVHIPAGPEIYLPKRELSRYIPEFAAGILDFSKEKKLHYDLIHSHYWMSGIVGIQLKKVWQVPLINMFHTLVQMKNRVARNENEIEGQYRLEGEMNVIQNADAIIAATQAEKSQLEFLYQTNSKKIHIIPPGVNTSRFYPIAKDEAKSVINIPVDQQMILFVGRIEPLKGLDVLLRALAILKDSGLLSCCPHYLAVIGGDTDISEPEMNVEMAHLQDLRKELCLEDLVVFLGKRSQDTLPYYYSAAEVVIMPSHYESFGMVALEAMACGTPVIASQVGGLAYLIQDNVTGFVVPDDEPEGLANKISMLLQDKNLREKFGRQGAEYAKDYSWENIADKVIDIYQNIFALNHSG
jgi:D-inositol-3-phosphate glycosyltransferase